MQETSSLPQSPCVIDFGCDWDAFSKSAIMQEEVFGPVMILVDIKSLSDAYAFINARSMLGSKPLAAYLFTNDTDLASRFSQSVTAGTVVINDCLIQTGNVHLPFGGVGESGLGGKSQGKAGFDLFSHTKSILRRHLYLDIPARYPPYNECLIRPLINPKIDRFVRFCRKLFCLRNTIDGVLLVTILFLLLKTSRRGTRPLIKI